LVRIFGGQVAVTKVTTYFFESEGVKNEPPPLEEITLLQYCERGQDNSHSKIDYHKKSERD